MNLLAWILFGLIIGIVSNVIDPAPERGGIVGAVLLGIVGALVGGMLANLVFGFGVSGFNLVSFIVAVLGSLLLLFVQRTVRRVE